MSSKEIRELETNIQFVQDAITNQINSLREELAARPEKAARLSVWAQEVSRQATELVQFAAWVDGLRQALFVLEIAENNKEAA